MFARQLMFPDKLDEEGEYAISIVFVTSGLTVTLQLLLLLLLPSLISTITQLLLIIVIYVIRFAFTTNKHLEVI